MSVTTAIFITNFILFYSIFIFISRESDGFKRTDSICNWKS